jgi:pimeloyl-ACP methyl ester carboxylesterase
MFEGFATRRIATAGAEIHLRLGGDGPPLLLHGYPQTSAMWHRVAPALAERFTVAAADLRGYGDSSRPPSGPDHAAYAKRAMAADLGRRRIACPLLVLWGDRGIAPEADDPLAAWRPWADDVRGHGVRSGRFLPEEAPAATLAALDAFL